MPGVIETAFYFALQIGLSAATAAALFSWQTAYLLSAAVYGASRQRREARRARDAYNASLQDRLFTIEQPNGVRQRVYGRVRTGGTILFKGTHGDKKEFLTLVVELACHPVDGIEQIWLDDKPVTLDGTGLVTSAPWVWSGSPLSVSQPITLVGGSWTGPLPSGWIAESLGASQDIEFDKLLTVTHAAGIVTVTGGPDGLATLLGQAANSSNVVRLTAYANSPNLAPFLQGLYGTGVIQNTDEFSGRALLLVQLSYSQDVFPAGVPRVTAVVRGAQVSDPRTNVVSWSENPAAIAWDWARYQYGGALPVSQMVQADFAAAANVCDISTNFSLQGGGIETRPLYQCGFVVPLDASPQDTLDQIVRAMAGRHAWTGGKLRVVAGSYRAPVFTIDEALVSDEESIDILPQVSSSELFNIGRTYFADAAQGYLEAAAPELRSQAFIDVDGGELVRETRLPTVTRGVHAQHITAIDMRDLRDGLTVKLPLKFGAFVLEVFDTVNVNLPAYGWTNKVFEVMSWGFSLQGAVVVELKEHSAATYQVSSDLKVIDAAPNTSLLGLRDIAPVNGFGVTAAFGTLGDGQIITKVDALWNLSSDTRVLQQGGVVIEWQLIGQNPQTVAWINQSSVVVPLVNQLGQTIVSVNAGGDGALAKNNWQRERANGDATKLSMTTLRAGSAYAFRAYNESALGVRSALSHQIYLQVPVAPLMNTAGIASRAVTELIEAVGIDGSVSGTNSVSTMVQWTHTNNTSVEYDISLTGSVVGRVGGVSPYVGEFAIFASFTSPINAAKFTQTNNVFVAVPAPIDEPSAIELSRFLSVLPGQTVNVSFAARARQKSPSTNPTTTFWQLPVLRMSILKR